MTGRAVTDAGPAGAGLLYDARRGVYYARPVLRGWLHLLCFLASLAGGALLLAGAHGGAHVTAAAVYSASLSALFGTSALYHRGAWTAAWRVRLRHLEASHVVLRDGLWIGDRAGARSGSRSAGSRPVRVDAGRRRARER